MRLVLSRATMLFAVAVTASAHAERSSVVASADNTLYESATGSLSNGSGDWLFAGKTGNGLKRRGLLRFDLSGIPEDATVTSASLILTHSQGQAVTANISLHRVLSEWGEGTSNAEGNEGSGIASTVGDATWIHTSFDTSLWSAPGGDFLAIPSAIVPVGPATGAYTWSGAGLVADVQGWVDGSHSNNGWVLVGDEAAATSTSKRFSTHENPARGERPTLVIEWTPAAPSPDLDHDDIVGPADLAILLGAWGQRGATDLDGDGTTGAVDLAILLGAWSA